ncbi:MAG: hypothetical protein J6U13_00140 [Salinivirgaceae bacterium]|nr:hypothetical protein [Salinivirgaceae bacterium]
MKNTILFIAFGVVLSSTSCNNNTKSNNDLAKEKQSEAVAAANSENAEEAAECKLDFKIGDEIPAELEGFTIERQTYYAEEAIEQYKYAVKKDGELIVELKPDYDYSTEKYKNTIGEIVIYSEKYRGGGNLHIGSPVSDVMAAYPNNIVVIYTTDELVELQEVGGTIQYFVDKEGYDGQLPEVYSIEGTIIENPTFKPDAVVSKIRMY